ncbi:RodZ family helix-turn-helix domain-containing protein [Pseudomonas sp. RL_15y_Pfl2_60]|uniref:RodZ family helix-turn-helix domain-containing protein n=1 Tax=Pseudomonas sp. RL_15y_Pfl2_60 TaxID=3088709 RepID=UPI0030DCF32D
MKSAPPEAVAANRVNPGETLRIAREAKGWSIAEVAAQLNLTPERLVQIETGAFDKLPGTTFARGYLRTYAKLLGVDQAEIVKEFDHFTGSSVAANSVQSLGRIEEPTNYSQKILRFVSFAILVVLGFVGFFWWQEQAKRQADDLAVAGIEHVEVEGADGSTQIHALDEPEDQAVAAAQNETQLDLSATDDSLSDPPEPPSDEMAAQMTGDETMPNAAPVEGQAVADNAPTTEALTPPVVEAPASTAAPQSTPAVAGEGNVSINFTANCWLQLKDANGKVIYSGLKKQGESLNVSGKAPLELRLGFASGAQVTYNGQAVDVAPYATGETARLKLGL